MPRNLTVTAAGITIVGVLVAAVMLKGRAPTATPDDVVRTSLSDPQSGQVIPTEVDAAAPDSAPDSAQLRPSLEEMQALEERRERVREMVADSLALHESINELTGRPEGFTGIAPRALTPEGIRWRQRTNLESEGFSPERAAELADFLAERRRELVLTGSITEGIDALEREMRGMLGEEDYIRYRRAMFLPLSVEIADVLPGSAAEQAGLMPGDMIESYDGRRVFDLGEVNRLAAEGSGEPVLIDVVRDGDTIQLVLGDGVPGVTERIDIYRGIMDLTREPPLPNR